MLRTLLIPLVVLAACAADLPVDPSADACGAEPLKNLLGQDMSTLAAMTFPDTTRFIGPGDAVTMDFSPRRLNFDLDEDGVILRIWCG